MSKKNKRHKLNTYYSPYENRPIKPIVKENPKTENKQSLLDKFTDNCITLDFNNPNALVTLAMLASYY